MGHFDALPSSSENDGPITRQDLIEGVGALAEWEELADKSPEEMVEFVESLEAVPLDQGYRERLIAKLRVNGIDLIADLLERQLQDSD